MSSKLRNLRSHPFLSTSHCHDNCSENQLDKDFYHNNDLEYNNNFLYCTVCNKKTEGINCGKINCPW